MMWFSFIGDRNDECHPGYLVVIVVLTLDHSLSLRTRDGVQTS